MDGTRFSDVGNLYSQKLLAERCLLIVTKANASEPLEEDDRDALARFRSFLQSLFSFEPETSTGSMLSLDVESARLVAATMTEARLVSSLEQMVGVVQAFNRTVSKLQNGSPANQSELTQLLRFLETLSAGLSHNLNAIASPRRGLYASLAT